VCAKVGAEVGRADGRYDGWIVVGENVGDWSSYVASGHATAVVYPYHFKYLVKMAVAFSCDNELPSAAESRLAMETWYCVVMVHVESPFFPVRSVKDTWMSLTVCLSLSFFSLPLDDDEDDDDDADLSVPERPSRRTCRRLGCGVWGDWVRLGAGAAVVTTGAADGVPTLAGAAEGAPTAAGPCVGP